MTTVADFIIPKFHSVLGDVLAHGHTHYWLHGGRGSTKSSFISICLVMLILVCPDANAVIVRRFGNTLRDSVYTQILWAIEALGLEDLFKTKVSPMEVIYIPTGQRIAFRGADDPLKLKGVKFSKGYCAAVWFEELDQFEGPETVRSILNSLRRGGDKFWIFYSYNPPKAMWSWVNVECIERQQRADTLVRKSSYLDVAETHPEWLGAPFIEEAEYLRDTNEGAWRWEYLGEIIGTGGAVFDNVRDEHIADSQIRRFDHVRNGLDWGWFPDPWRFVRCAWEPSARRLFIFEERSANKTMPADTGRMVVDSLTFPDEEGGEAYYHDQIVYCDDTPDSKVQMTVYRRELGIRIHAARKARMRRLSYEWLAGLRDIVIDPVRCPLTFTEFTLKEFERDREGRWLDVIPDGNDHSIDAVRYAVMEDVLRG